MNIQITFRGMDHSDAVENYVKIALEKVYKFIKKEPDPITFEIILEAHRQHHHHKAEIRLHSKHYRFLVEHEGPDLYTEIDYVVKHVIEEIKKEKGKALDKRNHTPEPLREDKEEFDDELNEG
jgi:ribosomal subunit interface protein